MVFESISDPREAEKHPWEMFFVGLLYSTLAIIILSLSNAMDRTRSSSRPPI